MSKPSNIAIYEGAFVQQREDSTIERKVVMLFDVTHFSRKKGIKWSFLDRLVFDFLCKGHKCIIPLSSKLNTYDLFIKYWRGR